MSSVTSRYAFLKPDPTENVDVVNHLNNNLDKADLNLGFRICTSSTRPSSPVQGMQIYETDTSNSYHYDGSTWRQIPTAATGKFTFNAGSRIAKFAANNTEQIWSTFINGETVDRFQMYSDGSMFWGPGSGSLDTNLYRSAANVLKTDDSLSVALNLTVGGIGQMKFVRKTANENYISNVSYHTDAELVLPLDASSYYKFWAFIPYTTPVAAGINMRFSYSGTIGSGGSYWAIDALSVSSGTSDTGTIRRAGSGLNNGFALVGGSGSTQFYVATPSGIINTNTAGNLTFDWSQNVSTATNTTVGQNAHILAFKVA